MDDKRFDFRFDYEDEIDDAEEEEAEEEGDGLGMSTPTRDLIDGTTTGGTNSLFGSLFPSLSLTSPSSGLTSPSHSLPGISPSLTSPSRPSYSMCGARLRWGNTGQVLSFPLSPSPSPNPSRDVTPQSSDCTESLSDSPLGSTEPHRTVIEEPIFKSPIQATQSANSTSAAFSYNLFEFMSPPNRDVTGQIIEPLSISSMLQRTTESTDLNGEKHASSPMPTEKKIVIDNTDKHDVDSLSRSPSNSRELQHTTLTYNNTAIIEEPIFAAPTQSADDLSSNIFEFMSSPYPSVTEQTIEPLSTSSVLQQTKSTGENPMPFVTSPIPSETNSIRTNVEQLVTSPNPAESRETTHTGTNAEPLSISPSLAQTTNASANAEPFGSSPKQTTKYSSPISKPLTTQLLKQTTLTASTSGEPLLAPPTQTSTAATASTTRNSCAEAKREQCCHRNHSLQTASHNFAFALSVVNFPLDASRRQKLSRSLCEDQDWPLKDKDEKSIRGDAFDYNTLDIAKLSTPSGTNSDLFSSSEEGINRSFADSSLLSQSERDNALPSERSSEGGESNYSSSTSSTRREDSTFSSLPCSESDSASPADCHSSSSNSRDYIFSSPSASSEVHPSSPNRRSNIDSDIVDLFSIEKSTSTFADRFVSTLDIAINTMPVPESFTSSWSIKHEPALHMASDKLKKFLGDKDLITRDDNHNIEEFEEVTETEVPASRLYSGLKNGNNGVHHPTERLRFSDVDGDKEVQEPPLRSVPDNIQYSESVSVCRVPAQVNYREGVRCDIDDSRHHRSEVRMVPGGAPEPGRYYSTMTQCFINSKYRRYKETVFVTLNAPSAKQYTTSVFIFPKSTRETFVSELEHLPEERIKWYKSCVNMEARDYVSVKFLQVN